MGDVLDLGHGHSLEFVGWSPDRGLNPQYEGIPDCERYGAIIHHPRGPNAVAGEDSPECQGVVIFASETQQRIDPGRPAWTVESWEPLTISPSVLCSCGDHGFVREGKWVPA